MRLIQLGQLRFNLGNFDSTWATSIQLGELRFNLGQFRFNLGQFRFNLGQLRFNLGNFDSTWGNFDSTWGNFDSRRLVVVLVRTGSMTLPRFARNTPKSLFSLGNTDLPQFIRASMISPVVGLGDESEDGGPKEREKIEWGVLQKISSPLLSDIANGSSPSLNSLYSTSLSSSCWSIQSMMC